MKNYISNLIPPNQYSRWIYGKKIMLTAPTGMGKTTFILSEFLPYCASFRKRVAILCNRRLLRKQYIFELAENYRRFYTMNEEVQLFTYQFLGEQIKQGVSLVKIFDEFDVIICDESHYFYADSDFNGYGTYILLQAFINACIKKSIIFITATADEVTPLIEQTLQQCAKKLGIWEEDYYYLTQLYDFSYYEDYSRFECIFVEDEQSLCRIIGESIGKSIIFIDDKQKAEALKKHLEIEGGIKAKDVFLLCAEVMDENDRSDVILKLSICHKVIPKVLITTSVLDNGVSIHDPEVENIVIATDSKLSFKQMLGRVRSESSENCKLYLYPRQASYYQRRIEQSEEKIGIIEKFSQEIKNKNNSLVMRLWDESDKFYRNAVLIVKEDDLYYNQDFSLIRILCGGYVLTVNEFALEKIGNLKLDYLRFLKLSMTSMEEVAKAQLEWIGKKPDELKVISSSYRVERENKLRKCLLEIKNATNEELQNKKKEISQNFRKDLLGDIVMKNDSFSKDKLIEICNRFDLKLEETSKDGRKLYSVVENK